MSGKATAVAPSNIAFIKYWGTRDADLTVPYNPSISMTLADSVTRCTVEHDRRLEKDEVLFRAAGGDLAPAPDDFAEGVRRHLEFLRRWGDVGGAFRVATENSFPTGAGMASSASGFAALTLAVVGALGREEGPDELSILARRSGSGSAARSLLGGYVEWPRAGDDEGAAIGLAGAEHWDLRDVVAVVDAGAKEISSREGHRRAPSSPLFEERLAALPARLEAVRGAIRRRSLEDLGPVIEKEAIELHLIAMSSRQPIFYWQAGTLAVLRAARELREAGAQVFATIDAGPNVHLICRPEDEDGVVTRLEGEARVQSLIRDRVGPGAHFSAEHLA